MEGGIAAAVKFSGKTTEELVRSKEKELRSSLLKDGLEPREGCLLARYNDPGRTWSFVMVRFSSLSFKKIVVHFNKLWHGILIDVCTHLIRTLFHAA